MLQVTARVFDNNQLVGYQISDGQQTQLFTRQQAWVFAKNKQLLNVIATGDETNPGLSGTNGFELKRLTEIKWKEPPSVKTSQKFKFTTQDMAAAFLRYAINTGNYNIDEADVAKYGRNKASHELARTCLRNDVNNGVVTPQNCRTLSSALLIENTLYDSTSKAKAIIVGHQLSEEDKESIKMLAPLYSSIRLVSDLAQEAMNISHTDSITVSEIQNIIDRDNSETINRFKQQGGNANTLIKGMHDLQDVFMLLPICLDL